MSWKAHPKKLTLTNVQDSAQATQVQAVSEDHLL